MRRITGDDRNDPTNKTRHRDNRMMNRKAGQIIKKLKSKTDCDSDCNCMFHTPAYTNHCENNVRTFTCVLHNMNTCPYIILQIIIAGVISIRRRGGPGPQPGRGAAGIEIAPASDFGEFRGLNPSPAPTFPKISSFRNFRVHAPDAWLRITFLIRNAQTR